MTRVHSSPDIVRTMLALISVAILMSVSFWILRPFLPALVWAAMIVVTTWPLMISVQKRLFGKRVLAVSVMTIGLLLLLIVPLTFAVISIVDRADEIVGWVKSIAGFTPPPPPLWLERLPVIGHEITARWHNLTTVSPAELSVRLEPYVKNIANWLVAEAGSGMMIIIQFLLTVIISAVLYATGEKAASGIRLFARRLGGRQGEDAVVLAGKTIRSVALGVVVTAVIQTILGGIGLAAAGVPAVALLMGLMFILCVAQVGPGLVLIPAIIWLFWKDQNLWGSLMIVWFVLISVIDNFVRPFLIRMGADLPLLLIFAGVFGGLMAFGVIGLFIGPVMLAVTFALLEEWVRQDEPEHGES